MKIIISVLTFFMMLFGITIGANNFDTISGYKKTVKSVDLYENTMETAMPQTEIYNIINDYFNEKSAESKKIKKAIVLGYDGCRADALSLIDSQHPSAIKTLTDEGGKCVLTYCGGKNLPAFNTQDTSTAPGWCTMLTGKWADITGVTGNGIPKSNNNLTLLTTLVEDETISSSAFCVSWGGHFSDSDSTYINEKEYCQSKNLSVAFDKSDDDEGTKKVVTDYVNSKDCPDFIFSIFEYCDHCGHSTGFNLKNPDYTGAFFDAEKTASEIINDIKARDTFENEEWLIIITSDHGGYNLAHGMFTPQERYIFTVTKKY